MFFLLRTACLEFSSSRNRFHGSSQVSQPIAFRDILGAERLPLPTKSRKGKNAMPGRIDSSQGSRGSI